METYPKRPSHFAHKLVRLMLHSCAAQEIGPDGFLVVTAIAHAEDAKRYSGAVTYWNEQLIPILGFGSWGQLDRARKKAVDAGWLHYDHGGKGKVGKYWTTVPAHLLDAPDVSTESDHHVSLSNSGEDSVKETGKKRDPNVREPGDNRGTSGEHSTLLLNPTPNPTPNTSPQAAEVVAVVNGNGIHKRSEYPEAFERFWTAYRSVRKVKKGDALKAWKDAVKTDDPEKIIQAAAEYGLSPMGDSEYGQMPASWLRGRCWDDDRRAWQGKQTASTEGTDIPF